MSAEFWRGGTSKALLLPKEDLPVDRAEWSPILLAMMGSPDPYGRQLDGMGGGLSSVSKVCIIDKSSIPDADIDYTFVQVAVRGSPGKVDYASNCGNMVSALGPYAIEHGYRYRKDADGRALVRIYNTNTQKIIESRFALDEDAQFASDGTFTMDGVPGTAAQIQLDFLDPAGSKTGKLLPTGNAVDMLRLSDGDSIEASMVDCANPTLFLRAKDLGLSGRESPAYLSEHPEVLDRLEDLRRQASIKMGLASSEAEAAAIISIPKVTIVSSPTSIDNDSGATKINLCTRTISSGDPHKAIPITVALCTAAARALEGSVVASVLTEKISVKAGLTIGHPSGTVVVGSREQLDDARNIQILSGTLYRTARKLFQGKVFFRAAM